MGGPTGHIRLHSKPLQTLRETTHKHSLVIHHHTITHTAATTHTIIHTGATTHTITHTAATTHTITHTGATTHTSIHTAATNPHHCSHLPLLHPPCWVQLPLQRVLLPRSKGVVAAGASMVPSSWHDQSQKGLRVRANLKKGGGVVAV